MIGTEGPAVRRAATRCDLEDALEVRYEVFVDEQGVPVEEEVDGADAAPTTVHVVAEVGGVVVGTGRLLTDPAHPGEVHLGRLAVRADVRGSGLGAAIVDELERIAQDDYGVEETAADGSRWSRVTVELSAQEQAAAFYVGLGYELGTERYLDAGIWHRDAVKVLRRPVAEVPGRAT